MLVSPIAPSMASSSMTSFPEDVLCVCEIWECIKPGLDVRHTVMQPLFLQSLMGTQQAWLKQVFEGRATC